MGALEGGEDEHKSDLGDLLRLGCVDESDYACEDAIPRSVVSGRAAGSVTDCEEAVIGAAPDHLDDGEEVGEGVYAEGVVTEDIASLGPDVLP